MQEKELNINTGLVSYNFNDQITVKFNPTDTSFVERLYSTFDTLDKKQDSYREELQKLSSNTEIFHFAQERDAEMRELIDSVFNAPVCDALFGNMNVYAMADGLPVWCNLMMAILDEVDASYEREDKATQPRISKYKAKYKKYQNKYPR